VSTQKVGRYEVIREIGRGGMAIVYLANDPFFERQVAVKVISRRLAEDATNFEQFRARFQREAKVIAALEHSCIVPVYDYGEDADAGEPFIVMRYMTGGTLSDRMTGKPMPLSVVVPIVQRLAEALQAAHRRGIVHRDLKPGNVLFDAEGDAFLSDFGIAKMKGVSTTTSTGTAIGTFGYMSPEQAQGAKEIDGRSDLYALGVILYEMLTGHQPFEADTPLGLALKHMTEPIPPLNAAALGLPAELELILRRVLAKKPEDRYSTAEDLSLAVSALYAPATTLGAAPTTPSSASRPTSPAHGGVSPVRPTVRAGGRLPLSRLIVVGGVLGAILLGAAAAFLTPGFFASPRATGTAMAVATAQAETATAIALANRPTATSPPTHTPSPTLTLAPSATPPPTSTDTPTPTPTIAPGAVMTSTVDGMAAIYIPEGEFYMGSSLQNDPQAARNEQPQRLVYVSAFWIDQTEVTNAQYEQCVSAGVCTQPASARYADPAYGRYPVVAVTWFQASEYCAWAGGRLPTEAEWEKAARGPASSQGARRIWPWGNNTPTDKLANFDKHEGNTVAVGSYPRGASPYGVLDMAGNAWEWVADYYAEDYYQTALDAGLRTDPAGPEKGVFRVTRGGSYLSDATYIRLAIRLETTADRRAGYIGFRCVRPMTPGATKPLPTPQP
jgi:serine/threonine-protein kinase